MQGEKEEGVENGKGRVHWESGIEDRHRRLIKRIIQGLPNKEISEERDNPII